VLQRLSDNDTSEEVLNANSCIVLTGLPACSKFRFFNNNNSEKAFPTSQIFGKTGVIWKYNNRMGKWI
jgi:hypothetical protein